MRTIICPTDFSNAAFNATKYAAAFADELKAQLHLIHVMHVPVVDVNSSANVLTTLMDTQKEASDNKLEAEVERLAEHAKCPISYSSMFGLAADVIVSETKKLGGFLVIMGTNGASNVFDQLLGTVSFGVAKRSEIPVIVVPPASIYNGLKRVAFADDHKESLNDQRKFLYDLTNGLKSKIDLISVDIKKDEEYEEEIICNEGGIRQVCVWSDSIESGLSRFTARNEIELLAIKRHHRTFFEELFHKSTTKEVLNKTKIPVLIFN